MLGHKLILNCNIIHIISFLWDIQAKIWIYFWNLRIPSQWKHPIVTSGFRGFHTSIWDRVGRHPLWKKTPRRWLFLEQTFLRSLSFMIFAIWQWILLPASQFLLSFFKQGVLHPFLVLGNFSRAGNPWKLQTMLGLCVFGGALDDSCLTLVSHVCAAE